MSKFIFTLHRWVFVLNNELAIVTRVYKRNVVARKYNIPILENDVCSHPEKNTCWPKDGLLSRRNELLIGTTKRSGQNCIFEEFVCKTSPILTEPLCAYRWGSLFNRWPKLINIAESKYKARMISTIALNIYYVFDVFHWSTISLDVYTELATDRLRSSTKYNSQ